MLTQATMPEWRQFEGQVANGEFRLERYLGSSETAAVFLTELPSGRAAIKLQHATPVQAGELVERWKRAATLHHPHLAEIHAAGIEVLAGTTVAYLVTEYAEEDLAEVLRDRPLTSQETREMLLPVADALAYLHSQGLVHGDLKPSNILAVGDTVKIASDAVSAGDPAVDIRALGATLVQALTQRQATPGRPDPALDALPFPFRPMAENCFQSDPSRRWSAGQVAAWLRSPEQPPPAAQAPASSPKDAAVPSPRTPTRKPRFRLYAAAAAVTIVGAAIIGSIAMRRTSGPIPAAGQSVRPEPGSAAPVPAVPPPAPPATMPGGSSGEAARDRVARDGITRRVLPKIPQKARDTIVGRPSVLVRVTVDPAGRVTEAALERSFSPYFGKLVLEAARQWRFTPQESGNSRAWILRFEITQSDTRVTARAAGRK